MLNSEQINELALIVLDANIDTKNHHAVDEYIGLLLENIAGCECLSDDEIESVQFQIRKIIEAL